MPVRQIDERSLGLSIRFTPGATHLGDNNEVCPPVFHASVIECSLKNSSATIVDSLRPKITHAVARFNGSQCADARSPLRVS
jgi:hypothetical protein